MTQTLIEAAKAWRDARNAAKADVSPETFAALASCEAALAKAVCDAEGEVT